MIRRRSSSTWTAVAVLLTGAAASRGAIDHGEILLDELSCTSCHQAAPQAQDRFFNRPGPVLGANGFSITPQWLRAFLDNPSAIHPGTVMPDVLHGMAPAEKARTIEDLTQYMVSREPAQDKPFDCPPALISQGEALYHTVGCVACHAPSELPSHLGNDPQAHSQLAALQQTSQPFPDLTRMTSVPQLAAFLQNPVHFHPAGRMPSSKLTADEATAISAYLLRDQVPPTEVTVPGIRYDYYERHFSNLPNFARLKITSSGSEPSFSIGPRKRNDNIAFLFKGFLRVPTAGAYQFYTNSDDGSELLIDGKRIIENDGIHQMTEKSGGVMLNAGQHEIEVRYFNAEGELGLQVSWEGPGITKQEVPASALAHGGSTMSPTGAEPFKADAAAAARGQALFAQLNCAACHHGEMPGTQAKPLDQLTPGAADCISPAPAKGLPFYALGAADREAIRSFLRNRAELSKPLDPHATVDRTLTLLNCYACHERDDQGGPQGFRRDYFTSEPPDLDLGDEGRIPPRLTGVGAKLQEQWMDRVLMEGASVRPYFATRMPQFGNQNVGFLAAAFLKADSAGVVNPDYNSNITVAQSKAGRKLVGVTGLACIACHNFNDHPSLGIPAMDLTVMTERLQTGWFHRYLIDPQSLRPGTRMPSFWPGSHAVNRDVMGGDTDKQIQSIWGYLAACQNADLPDGLIRAKMELSAGTQAIIYRNFITGVGPRAIAVGYPEKANLAFDAGDMRIALIWQGSFIDASQQRTGRGKGSTPPLGHNVLEGAAGPPFAELATPDAEWPMVTGKSAGYQFRGYHLDDNLRPAFSYDYNGVHITDYPVAVAGKDDPGFKRTLSYESANPPQNLYVRAAVGNKIIVLPDGGYQVDRRLTLRFHDLAPAVTAAGGTVEVPAPPAGGPAPFIRSSQGKMELLVPIRFSGPKAAIEEDYLW